MEILRHRIYQILVGLSALILAGSAAYFSIFGLSKLFIGAALAGIILFSGLEFGKIIAVSYLHRYWSTIDWFRKTYMTFGVVILMLLTSMGIYGFLSASYQSTSTNLGMINNEIKIIENKQNMFTNQIDNLKKQVDFRDKRINQLTDLRNQQETRLDTLYKRNTWSSTKNAKNTEENIKESNKTIETLNNEITKFNSDISSLTDSLSKYDSKILELNNNEYNTDLGPLKYISQISNIPMDRVVNYLILLIIFVFDPMAIALLLAFNHISDLIFNLKNEKIEGKIEDVVEEKKSFLARSYGKLKFKPRSYGKLKFKPRSYGKLKENEPEKEDETEQKPKKKIIFRTN